MVINFLHRACDKIINYMTISEFDRIFIDKWTNLHNGIWILDEQKEYRMVFKRKILNNKPKACFSKLTSQINNSAERIWYKSVDVR